MIAHDAWLARYHEAWVEAHADDAVELFAPDAVCFEAPFSKPFVGVDGIRTYWERATATKGLVEVTLGEALLDRDTAIIEWWARLKGDSAGGDETLPGVMVLEFAPDGRCSMLREYWARTDGQHEPFVEWGLQAAGDTRRTRRYALHWANEYGGAWSTGDIDRVVALFSDDVIYRSHPLRTPHRGREGVRAYTVRAFGQERDVSVRMQVVAVANGVAGIEYWATRLEKGKPLTLAGCDLLTFESDGRCRALREYWVESAGLLDTPTQWWGVKTGDAGR